MILELLALGSFASSVYGSIAGGNASRRAANASVEEGDRLARETLLRGEETARRYGIDLAQLLGRQRAVLGASGVDLTSGSAVQIAEQTEAIGAQELATIRENARREAYGLRRAGRNQSLGLRAQAASQYGQAFESVLNFGANAWAYRQQGAGARANRALTATASLGPMFY